MNESKAVIENLLHRFGAPLYVFDEQGFAENYARLHAAMSARYDRYQIAYSFKTNYTPYICSTAKRLGAYAEVVSGMEYALAKRIGYSDEQIIFNGPDKGSDGITAMLCGCMVHADSLDELEALCAAARDHSAGEYKIGLRINIDVEQSFVSRFGMDDSDAEEAFRMVQAVGNLRISGLHCHISRCRSKAAWRARTEQMLDLADRLFDCAPEFLDLGSGMYGSMAPEFAAQFGDIPSYEEYAEVTAGLLAQHYQDSTRPILFTEPGTTLVNRFVECIARVDAIKEIRGHSFAVMNASEHNLGETCLLKRLPFRVVPCGAEQRFFDSIDLTGYTCLEQDVLLPAYKGMLAKGDYIIFGNVGGYSTVLKPPFIRPDCAMVARKPNGEYVIIKNAETNDHIFDTYLF